MKKMTALLLALLLAVMCIPAMAEETQVYTHPTQGFSITLPADWLVVDNTNVDAYIAAYENGEMTFAGTNAQTLTQLKAQTAVQDCAIAINENSNNLVMMGADLGVELTNEQFVQTLIPSFKQQIAATMPGLEFTSEGEIVTLGENEFIFLSAEMDLGGAKMYADQVFMLDGTMMYLINVTATDVYGAEAKNAFYAQLQTVLTTFTTK